MVIMDRWRHWTSRPSGPERDAVTEGERLMMKEANEPDTHWDAIRDSQRRLKRWVLVLSLLLASAVIALLMIFGTTSWKLQPTANTRSPVPFMPSSKVTFERDNLFAAPSTPESDQAWGSMSPDGDGFIIMPNSTRQKYNPPGKQTARGEVYDISLFHQLHCLVNIRTHTFTLQAALGRDNWQEIYDILLKHQEDHVYHCFDYIRQALMCAGDMTVEWPRTEPDGRRFAVDGWGITHECKSWDAIMEFMRENTVSNVY